MKQHNFLRLLTLTLTVLTFAPLAWSAEPVPINPAGAPEETGTITLDFKEADINTVLRVMSLKSKINIVAGPEVQGTVTIRLENVPWEKALEVVLRTYGYVYERDGNIIRVTTRENLAQEPVITQTQVLNYTKASEIQDAVQDILTERGRIKVAERTNAIVITDIPTNLYLISQVIKKLDKITPQAYIDSKIVNTSVGTTENLGVEWRTGGATNNIGSLTGSNRPTTFPFISGTSNPGEGGGSEIPQFLKQFFPPTIAGTSGAANAADPRGFPVPGFGSTVTAPYTWGTLNFSSFNAVLQLLKSRTATKVISNPRIVVLNNQKASIHVGDNVPLPKFETNQTTGRLVVSGFDYDKLKTGVSMEVTPHINSEDEILVDLQPSVNVRGANITFNADLSAPIINETTAKSQVLIRSGQTIAIGGLLTDSVQSDEAKVPYFGDVPFVGKLFRSKRQTAGSGNTKVETLFFVTVTTVDTEGQPMGDRASRLKKAEAQKQQAPAPTNEKKVETANQTEPKKTETEEAPENAQATEQSTKPVNPS